MLIYLARHGQPFQAVDSKGVDPEYPPGDPPLSRLGERQALKLGERLKKAGFTGEIHASPYHRSSLTADIAARALNLYFHPEPAIRELTGPNINSFTGLDQKRLCSLFPRMSPGSALPWPWWTTEPEFADPESGNRPDVEKRVRAFLDTVIAPGKPDILLVGHGASMGAAARILYPAGNAGSLPESEHPGRMWNCALTIFRLEKERLFSIMHNDTSHLEPDEVTSNGRKANPA